MLVAPKCSLVARNDLHAAIQYLLLEAASELHSKPGIFQKAGQFPAAIDGAQRPLVSQYPIVLRFVKHS